MPKPPPDADPWFHREITLRVEERRLSLRASQELFSSHAIDTGTLRLIRSLADPPGPVGRALDLGCGYGPIAASLRVRHPDCDVVAVDRDRLALDYTRENLARAGLRPVAVLGSLGFDDVDGTFDVVVSNVPGKGAPGFHADLLDAMLARLRPGGTAAVVVVNPLAPLVDALGEAVAFRDEGREHTVFHLRSAGEPPAERGAAFDRGVYDRGVMPVAVGRIRYDAATVHGLPEFDALGFHTAAALELLDRRRPAVGDAVVVNPGQGHLAMALAVGPAPATSIRLVDRDLLALRTATRNLARVGVVPAAVDHDWRLDGQAGLDLAVANLRAKEPPAVHAQQGAWLGAALRPGGSLLAAGPTHAVDRFSSALAKAGTGLRERGTVRRRGHAAVILEKPAAPS